MPNFVSVSVIILELLALPVRRHKDTLYRITIKQKHYLRQ